MSHFADRLADAVREKGNPVLVGLDPRAAQIPDALKPDDENPEAIAAAFTQFCKGVIDTVAPLVPAVKPQAAFFEQYGAPGFAALQETVDYAKAKGLIVLLDGKRNDIGSTATAYAQGLIGGTKGSPMNADALTVSPYLGDDSLLPFVETCKEREAGIFVLVKTSNPGGGMFQDLVADGKPIYRHVAEYVEQRSVDTLGSGNYGLVGAVVGATYPEQLAELRETMSHVWILIPGFGSQGGTAADVAAGFDADGLGAIVNNSRGIIFAYSRSPYDERFGQARWQDAVEAATLDMIEALRTETPAGQLKK